MFTKEFIGGGAGTVKVKEVTKSEKPKGKFHQNHEAFQGVFAIRHGEYRQYMEADEMPPEDVHFAVAVIPVPEMPFKCSSKAENLCLVCAGRSGTDGNFGYLHLEKDTKQMIAEDMMDKFKLRVGVWYWLKLTRD